MHSVPTARLNHVREGSLFTVTMAENSSPEKSSPGRYGGEWSPSHGPMATGLAAVVNAGVIPVDQLSTRLALRQY